MNFWKRCPLLILLLVSGLIISAVSLVNLDGSYQDFEKKTVMAPVLAAFFQGMKEETYPWSDVQEELVRADEEEPEEELTEKEDGQPSEASKEEASEVEDVSAVTEEAMDNDAESVKEAEASEDEADTPKQLEETREDALQGITEPDGTEQIQEEQREEEMPEKETPETDAAVWQLDPVEEEYFDDALFIGDSRTQGLYEYGGFSENVTFYCKTSLTVYDLFKKNKAFIKEGDRKLTLEQALTEHSFGKIYLMIGINEMGTGTAESFFEEYARAVFRIRQLQPDAVIFLQAIMRVGAQKNASDPVFNNMNIAIRNVEIETLADDQSIFYLDINEVFCDENGNLFDGWSNDQIHLKAKYYAVWKEYLLNHGAVEKGQKIS